MKFKGLILAIACLVLLSSIASADFVVRSIYAISGSSEDWLEDGEKIYVRPGTTLQIKGAFENNFTKDSKIDIDIDMEVIIDDIDGGSILREYDRLGLDPETVDSIILTFQIPRTTSRNNYKLELEIDAEDDSNNNYNYDYDYPIEVVKPEHEVLIDNIKLGSDVIECEPSIDISFDILNTGDRDEDDVKYIIENADLGIYLKRTGLIIDEGETKSIAQTVIVDDSAPAGDYTIDVSAYCDDDKTSVKRSITIEKETCSAAAQTDDTTTQQDTQISTQQTDSTTAVNNEPADSPPTDTQSSEDSTAQRVIIIPESEPPKKSPLLPTILLTTLAVIMAAVITYFLISAKK